MKIVVDWTVAEYARGPEGVALNFKGNEEWGESYEAPGKGLKLACSTASSHIWESICHSDKPGALTLPDSFLEFHFCLFDSIRLLVFHILKSAPQYYNHLFVETEYRPW